MMCTFLRLSAARPGIDDDIRFAWPVIAPGAAAPAPFIVDTADIELARAAVANGARCILVRTADDLDPVDRMAVALAVIEAEAGLDSGTLAILALVAGPGAVLALLRATATRPRLVALGLDGSAFPAADSAPRHAADGLLGLVAAARQLPAFLAGPAGQDAAGYGHRLIASAKKPETA